MKNRHQITARGFFEQGQNSMTDAIAHQRLVVIRWIVKWSPAHRVADGLGIGASQGEQWMANLPRRTTHIAHCRQTVESGTTKEIQNHGFGLVVGRVTRHHVGWQVCVTRGASTRLEVWACSYVDGDRAKISTHELRTVANEVGLEMRTATQSMIDVDRRHGEFGCTS